MRSFWLASASVLLPAALLLGYASSQEPAKQEDPKKEAPKQADPKQADASKRDYSMLLKPEDPKMNETAPATFLAKFETSKGDFVIEVTRDWAPLGADRFYNLVKNGYYDNVRFFRVLKDFMAQFGINGDPKVNEKWKSARINDDPVKKSNTRGMVTFAMAGANTRTTQLFINYKNNSNLDSMGFSPFGQVKEGMEVVDSLYNEYGEGAPKGKGPSQPLMQEKGNSYLEESFPKLDYVKRATIVTK